MFLKDKIEKKIKDEISLYVCRHKNVQDFFIIKKDDVNTDGIDREKRIFHDINNEEDYEKLCREFNFSVPDADINQRFSEKKHLCVITENGKFCCFGWYAAAPSDFYVLEIDRITQLPENMCVIFHCFSNPECRRQGYYYDLLRLIVSEIGKEYTVIYTYDTNVASSGAIKKAGFSYIGRMGHNDFTDFKEFIK